MLSYYPGSELHTLGEKLRRLLQEKPRSNPLSPEIVIVQNHAMARWISLYLAERDGVTANLEFDFPAERIWALIRQMDPGIPKRLPSDRIPMAWSILYLLRENNDPRFNMLQQYAGNDDPAHRDMRRWKLAGRIADVFDQYLTYRPDMILEWEKNSYQPEIDIEPWQPALWNALINHWDNEGVSDFVHPARLQHKIIQAIDDGKITCEDLPERISVFAVSTMPPVYLKILVKLSKIIDVHFFLSGPQKDALNSLSESLGKTGFEYRELLHDYISQENIEPVFGKLEKPINGLGTTLLHRLQTDLLEEEQKVDSTEYQWDESILVHSCHSPRREVEVLYDQLLAMLDEDEKLNPSDIMVLAPDLEIYAPEIEAIFGTVEKGLPEIPFHLADRHSSQSNPVFNTVLKLLRFIDGRFKVTELLDLLDSEPLQLKLNLSDDALNKLEQWIDDTNIRWGVDGGFKASLGLPETKSFTWKAGLERVILGYAMKQDDDQLFEGIYPYTEVEQTDDTLLAGRFAWLLNTLFQFQQEVNKPKNLDEWSAKLKKILTGFFPQQEYSRDLQKVRDLITDLAEYEELSGFKGNVPFRIIHDYLKSELEKDKIRGGRAGRGVTFGSLVQMRNIPAKVICLLGMDDGSFPRQKIPVAFDVMSGNPEKGDRSHSSEDRQLFLETLLAAKKQLYLSYVGQSNRHDTDYPPSVVVRELIDYLVEHYGVEEELVVKEHPLQPFSPKYFKPRSTAKDLFSYSAKHRNIAEKLIKQEQKNNLFLNGSLPEPDPEYKKLSLNELISFFQHPAKFMLTNRFGIYFNQDKILDEDREPFQMDSLKEYQLGQELLNRVLTDDSSIHDFRKIAHATDILPEGWTGEQAFSSKAAEATEFGGHLQKILDQNKLEIQEVDLHIDDYRITGRLDQIYMDEQVLYRFGGIRSKDFIQLWLKHLVFQLVKPSSHSGNSCICTRGRKDPVEIHRLLSIPDPRSILREQLSLYWEGLKKNILFFPDTSFAFAEAICQNQKEPEAAIKGAYGKWKNQYGNFPREGDDPYNRLLTEGANPLDDKVFQEVALKFWSPFFDSLKKGESLR